MGQGLAHISLCHAEFDPALLEVLREALQLSRVCVHFWEILSLREGQT